MDSTVPTNSYLQESIREITIGSVSGALGKVIEYPFDTIKVRLQYSQSLPKPLFHSTIDCINKTYSKEGFLGGFYKGLSSPLVGAAMEYASLFWSYDLSKIMLSKYVVTHDGELGMRWKIVAGGMSGMVTSFVLTPVELIKCQMQINNLNATSSKAKGQSIWQMIAKIYNDGSRPSLLNFWKGQSSTLLRETGGTMFWFGTYEYSLIWLRGWRNAKENTSSDLLISGAAAGITYNLSFFPIDTIKSVMQTNKETKYSKIASRIYKNGGIRKFYAGCGITVIRAMPSNAVVFYLYETMKKHFI